MLKDCLLFPLRPVPPGAISVALPLQFGIGWAGGEYKQVSDGTGALCGWAGAEPSLMSPDPEDGGCDGLVWAGAIGAGEFRKVSDGRGALWGGGGVGRRVGCGRDAALLAREALGSNSGMNIALTSPVWGIDLMPAAWASGVAISKKVKQPVDEEGRSTLIPFPGSMRKTPISEPSISSLASHLRVP